MAGAAAASSRPGLPQVYALRALLLALLVCHWDAAVTTPGVPLLDVACAFKGLSLVAGLPGATFCCTLKNPSTTLAVVNYQLTCLNFQPLSLQGDITPRCVVDAYVAPRGKRSFCFVNDANAGTPLLNAYNDPYPVATIETINTSSDAEVTCTTTPKFDQLGRDVIATFFCTVTNKLPVSLAGVLFTCTNFRPIYTNNFNPDCTFQGLLAPAGVSGSSAKFKFSVLPNEVSLDLVSVLTLGPA